MFSPYAPLADGHTFSEKGGGLAFSYSVLTPEWEVRRIPFLRFLLIRITVLCGEGGDVAEVPPLYCHV